MKIKDGDFMWLGDTEGTIDWAVVYNGKLILQNGGFEELCEFNEYGEYKDYDSYFIGGIVRNASSFASARAFYEFYISENDRFLNHHTDMIAMSTSMWAMNFYREHRNTPREMTLGRLSDIFGQKIEIG